METIETNKARPSKVLQYVVVIVAGLGVRIIGKALRADGWGSWPDYTAAAVMYGLLFSLEKKSWQEKRSAFLFHTLWMWAALFIFYVTAPYLSNYFHVAIAYGLSAVVLALGVVLYRALRAKPFSAATFYKELAFGLVCSALFGVFGWVFNLLFHWPIGRG